MARNFRQSGDRDRLDDRADLNLARPFGFRSSAFSLLRLRSRQRSVRVRLESFRSIHHAQDRQGLPKYFDAEESDIFILSGAEDLVPVLIKGNDGWKRQAFDSPASEPATWCSATGRGSRACSRASSDGPTRQPGISHWRSISKDNITTLYGSREDARIADPADPTRIFTWLICESYDDKGNAILYRYKPEDDADIDRRRPGEKSADQQDNFPSAT